MQKNPIEIKLLYIFILLTISCLTGCVKTPEEKAVVSKVEGLPEESILPAGDGEERTISPSEWMDTVSLLDDAVELDIHAEISVGSVANTPVWQLNRKVISVQEAEELVNYFAKGNSVIHPGKRTKDELGQWIDKIENGAGKYGSPFSKLNNGSYINNLKKLQEEAPDQEQEKKAATVAFDTPKITENEYMLTGGKPNFVVRTEKNRFDAEIDDGKGSTVKVIQDNGNAGTTSNFYYESCTVFTAEDLSSEEKVLEAQEFQYPDNEWVLSAKAILEAYRSKMEAIDYDMEAAKKQAEETLEELNISGMKVGEITPALCIPGAEADIWEADMGSMEAGYSISYYRDVEGIAAYWYNGQSYEIPENSYRPPFGQEKIEIVVTQSGIKEFRWQNMAELEKVIAPNTKLLDFEEIQDRFLKHMGYIAASLGYGQRNAKLYYDIDAIEFRYAYITAYGEPDKAWLVPVWVFSAKSSFAEGENINVSNINRFDEKLFINAIDGSYIDPNSEVLLACY